MIKKLILFYLVFLCFNSFAQQLDHDLNGWGGFNLGMKWTKKIETKIDIQTRWNNNLKDHSGSFIDLEAGYDIKKYIKFNINYRYNKTDFNPTTEYNHRFNLDLTLKKKDKWLIKTKRTDYSLRVRGQYEIPYKNSNQKLNEYTLRTKFNVKYNIKGLPLNPYLATEWFYSLRNPNYNFGEQPTTYSYFDKYRIKVGMEWSLGNGKSIDLFYIYQDQVFGNNVDHIISLKYSHCIIDKPFKNN